MFYLLDICIMDKSRNCFLMKVIPSPSKSSRNIKRFRKGEFERVFVRNKVNKEEKSEYILKNNIFH